MSIRQDKESEKLNAILTVEDTGRGIAPEMLAHVFDMFVQSDMELARRDGGMGLGLTVVKSLVEYHGGSISVHSDGIGHGATFTLGLPMTNSPRTDVERTKPVRQTAPVHRKTVLLIEDNADAREMLGDLLELEGWDVAVCENGSDGLESLCKKPPDLALVDIGLPELNGYEVAKQFRSRQPDSQVYLIALSGYGQTADIMKSEAAGFDTHLTKPVDPDELLSVINSVLQ